MPYAGVFLASQFTGKPKECGGNVWIGPTNTIRSCGSWYGSALHSNILRSICISHRATRQVLQTVVHHTLMVVKLNRMERCLMVGLKELPEPSR